ncbi:TPA: O-antigen polymerase [Photobacterium damselae]
MVSLALLILSSFYVCYRCKISLSKGNLTGFILNPAMYCYVFCIGYLLLPNYFITLGMYDVLSTGLPSNVYKLTNSVSIVNFFFIGVFFIYFFNKDKKGIKYELMEFKDNNEKFINILNSLIAFFLVFLLIKYGSTLISLRGDRAQVYSFFANNIYIPYKLGIVLNIYSCILIILFSSKKKFSRYAVLIPFFLFILLDFIQGGRSIAIRLLCIIYILKVIIDDKLYIKYIFYSLLFLIVISAFGRIFNDNSSDGLFRLFTMFGEFSYTRVTVDYVLNYHLSGEWYTSILHLMLTFLPSSLSYSLLGDKLSYMESISSLSGLSWGLGGSIVSESIFYFGNFWFVSILFLFLFCKLYNSYFMISNLPFFVSLLIFISNIQNIIRTGFFDFGFVLFYLLISYLLFFSVVFFNKKPFVYYQ